MKLSFHCKRNFCHARFGKLVEVVEKNKSRLNKGLKMGAFYNQYDGRKVLNRDVVETINAHFKGKFSRQNIISL
jgi:chromosome partitioning protein